MAISGPRERRGDRKLKALARTFEFVAIPREEAVAAIRARVEGAAVPLVVHTLTKCTYREAVGTRTVLCVRSSSSTLRKRARPPVESAMLVQ